MTHFTVNRLVTMVGLVFPAHLAFNGTSKKVGATILAILVLGALKLDSFALFSLGIQPLIFWLTPHMAEGFQWREGFANALISPVALSMLQAWTSWFLH